MDSYLPITKLVNFLMIIRISKNAFVEKPFAIKNNVIIQANVTIGKFCFINRNTTIYAGTTIGNYCSFGNYCEVGTFDHPTNWLSTTSIQYNIKKVYPNYRKFCPKFSQKNITQLEGAIIGNDVWIGTQSIIKSGIHIGDGAIIGAGSVVTKDVPPYAIVAGVPAKVIKYRFDDATISKLLKIKWWNMDFCELKNISFDDIDKAIIELNEIKNKYYAGKK